MSTRGAWGIRIENQDKITYNHRDAYPGGLGQTLIAFLKQYPNLTDKAKTLRVVKREELTDEQLRLLDRNTDNDYIKTILNLGLMIDCYNFLSDSLFCEWAYIINLDEKIFEVYRGFQDKPHQKGRYANLSYRKEYRIQQWWPVAFVNDFSFNHLPDNLAEIIKEAHPFSFNP